MAILASPLHQLTGFYLSVDCGTTSCGGQRAFAISDLAAFYKDRTVGEVLRLMRCSRGCGGRVLAAWLETGPATQLSCATAESAATRSGGQGVSFRDPSPQCPCHGNGAAHRARRSPLANSNSGR